MRHAKKKLSVLCIVIICLLSILNSVTISYAQDEVIPFVVHTTSGPGKFDPLDAYDSKSIETIMQVVEGLYIYNYSSPEMEPIPNLAANLGTWSLDGEGNLTILTVPLKEGVTFHNGEKFNASAVKWNFDRLQYWTYGFNIDADLDLETHPLGTASKTLFAQTQVPILNHTEIIDEYTVAFHLNMESVIWEKLLAFVACSIVLPDPDYEHGDTFFNRIDINDELVGTGPFILTDYIFDNEVIFDYNPQYHKAWGGDHIEQMIYLIIPDDVTSSLAVLNHEIHWGRVIADYREQFQMDPTIIEIPCKRATVYFMQMNLFTMKDDYRYASSFVWNHTYFLEEVLGGRHYELHVPVPDGMQYHHEEFQGEPNYNLTKAREILFASSDAEIQANLTLNGLSAISTREEWRSVAESATPIAVFNFTRYQSGLVELCAILLQDYLKDIGIKLVILDAMPWDDWVVDYIEDPESYKLLAYSFDSWGPSYNDPINMIEPLYGTNARENDFMLDNATWNQKLLDTYSVTGLIRRELFYEIQEEFCKIQVPSFYLLQLGGSISFNRDYVDEDTIGDLLNLFGDLYWFNIRFTPPYSGPPIWPKVLTVLFYIGVATIILVVIPVGIIKAVKRRSSKKVEKSLVKGKFYCPECGSRYDDTIGICDYCGKIVNEEEVRKRMREYT